MNGQKSKKENLLTNRMSGLNGFSSTKNSKHHNFNKLQRLPFA